VDPLDVRQDADRAPWMSSALLEAWAAMLEETSKTVSLDAPSPPTEGLILQENPRVGFTFRDGDRESFADRLARLDEVSADAERLVRYERMDDDLDNARLRRYDEGPLGLLVERAPSGWPLRPGDTVVSVDGRPVTRTHEWSRALRLRRSGAPLRLGLVRAEQRQEVILTEAQLQTAPAAVRVDTGGPVR
jgi:hypothetical protein